MTGPLASAHLEPDSDAARDVVAAATWLETMAAEIPRSWDYHEVPLPSPRWQRRWHKSQELAGRPTEGTPRTEAIIDRQVNEIIARDLNRSYASGFRTFLRERNRGAVTADMIALVRGSRDAHTVVSRRTIETARERVVERVAHRAEQLAHFHPSTAPLPRVPEVTKPEAPTVPAPRIVVQRPTTPTRTTQVGVTTLDGGDVFHEATRAQRQLITCAAGLLRERELRVGDEHLQIDITLDEPILLTPDSFNVVATTARILTLDSVPEPWRPAVRKDLDGIDNPSLIAAALYDLGFHARVMPGARTSALVHIEPLGR